MAYRTETDKKITSLQPPQSIDAERAVLGAVLKNSEAINRVIEIIQDRRDFYTPKHQLIFKAVVELYDRAEPIDITTVGDELQKNGLLDKIGGSVYLVDLVEHVASTANVAAYANIVLERGVLRRLIEASNEIAKSCYTHEQPVEELLDQAEANIFSISESRLRKGFDKIGNFVNSSIEQVQELHGKDGAISGIRTGFADLDDMTLGLNGGDLIVVAGRPSMGKTALAMNIAEHVATGDSDRKTVGIFSIEMSKEALVLRMLCGRARLNQHKVRSGKLNQAEWDRLARAGSVISTVPIYVDDSPSLAPLELRAKARRLMSQHGLDLIIVDYIQLMHSSVRAENRQQEISLITRNLKALAKELDVPVIALSQLSRAVEQRGGEKRPQLADLRESGAIEQDADLVLLLYREEFYRTHLERNDPKFLEVQGQAEVIIAKQRNGPTGTVKLSFISELARFQSLERQRHDLPQGVDPVAGPDGEEMPF